MFIASVFLYSCTREGKGNCLLVGSSSPTVVAPPNFASYPGQQYSADQQCQNIFGSSSYYCAVSFLTLPGLSQDIYIDMDRTYYLGCTKHVENFDLESNALWYIMLLLYPYVLISHHLT